MKQDCKAPRPWWICVALAAITLAVFSPLFHSDFLAFDDQIYVTENPFVLSGINWNSLNWAFHTTASGNWIPLTWLSHMVDAQVYGLWPGGHHLTNVLIHTANALLLFLLLRSMTGAVWRSAIVAALFAWHPAHVESVAWVAERKDVFSGFFFLLTLWMYWFYTRAAAPASGKRILFYLSVLMFFGLGLMAKPMLVTLPFVLLLLDLWPLRRPSAKIRFLILEKAPLFILSVASCFVAIWAQQRGHAVASAAGLPMLHRLEHVLASYLDYVMLLACPHHLAIFYPYPAVENTAKVAAGCLVLLGVSALALINHRRRPWLVTGWFWFIGMLVPVIGLLQVGDQAMADRYTYLPGIGLFVVIAWGGAELAQRFPVLKFFAAAAAIAMVAATWVQVHYWKDTRTVFERALRVTDHNFLAMTLLGSLRASAGDLNGATILYQQALQDKPRYPEAHFFYGKMLEQKGKMDEAKAQYLIATKLNPTFEQAHIFLGLLLARETNFSDAAKEYESVLNFNPGSAPAHNDLARLRQSEGRLDESIAHYLAALKFDPFLAQAHNNLGVVFLQKGQLAEGIAQLREAVTLNPTNAETDYNLGVALSQHGDWKEAETILQRFAPGRAHDANFQYQYGRALAGIGKPREAMSRYAQALLLTPDFPEALNALAWIAATSPEAGLRNGGQAVEMAAHACELTSRKAPGLLLTLAAAYAENGQFKEAMATAKEGKDLAVALGKKELATKATQMDGAFAASQPFRDKSGVSD